MHSCCYCVGLMGQVTKAFQVRGGPKVRVVWGTSDKYLNDAPMVRGCTRLNAVDP
jgi:hypothetical protein